jgi:hypothetical protein
MRTAFIAVAILLVTMALAMPVKRQPQQAGGLEGLRHHIAGKNPDFAKLPPLKQSDVIKALHQMILARSMQKPGQELNLNVSAALLPCKYCKEAVDYLKSHGGKWACDSKFDGVAKDACEAAGLGPLDPLLDICTAALVAGCNEIIKLIEKHISATDICKKIHLC